MDYLFHLLCKQLLLDAISDYLKKKKNFCLNLDIFTWDLEFA